MSNYVTVVYDVTGWTDVQIRELFVGKDISCTAWGHIPHERDSLDTNLTEANETLKFFRDKCHKLEKLL